MPRRVLLEVHKAQGTEDRSRDEVPEREDGPRGIRPILIDEGVAMTELDLLARATWMTPRQPPPGWTEAVRGEPADPDGRVDDLGGVDHGGHVQAKGAGEEEPLRGEVGPAVPKVPDDAAELDWPINLGRGWDGLDDTTDVKGAGYGEYGHAAQPQGGGHKAGLLVLKRKLQDGRARQGIDGDGKAPDVANLVRAAVILVVVTLGAFASRIEQTARLFVTRSVVTLRR